MRAKAIGSRSKRAVTYNICYALTLFNHVEHVLIDDMSALFGRAAIRTGQRAFKVNTRAASSGVQAKKSDTQSILQKGAKRDPELYVCSASR